MNIYFATCNPRNYKLKENWDDGNRRVLWGYGRTAEGKFRGSKHGDAVFIMSIDTAHNNEGDTLYHCIIEDGIEEFNTVEDYKNNQIDCQYVKTVGQGQSLKFYKLKIVGKTEKIRKQEIIETQNKDCPILIRTERNKMWLYPQTTKCLANRDYLKCDFSKLLLECKDELNLSDEEINLIREYNS